MRNERVCVLKGKLEVFRNICKWRSCDTCNFTTCGKAPLYGVTCWSMHEEARMVMQ